MDSQPNIFNNDKFFTYLEQKSLEHYQNIFDKFKAKNNVELEYFVNNVFDKHQKIDNLVIEFLSESFQERDRSKLISMLIGKIIFRSKDWDVSRFCHFLFSTKQYGFNFLVECISNLSNYLEMSIDETENFLCGKDNVLIKSLEALENGKELPIGMKKLSNIFYCASLLFPFVYYQCEQLSIRFFKQKGDTKRVMPNDCQILGITVNQVFQLADSFNNSSQDLQRDLERLREKMEKRETMFLSLKEHHDKIVEKNKEFIEAKKKYEQDVIDFFKEKISQKNSEIENLMQDYQRALATIEHLKIMLENS